MKKKTIDMCAKCGRTQDEHCEFVPVEIPETCVCNIREWGNPFMIPDVCNDYEEDVDPSFNGICSRCEHLKECHINKDS